MILHCEDYGMAPHVNAAIEEAMLQGLCTSTSIMINPTSSEAAINWTLAHPEQDVGIHITMNGEWDAYRWKPLLPASEVPSLVDADGFMVPPVQPEIFAAQTSVAEAKAEARAQIKHAVERGMKPTHLDFHCNAFTGSAALRRAADELAMEFNVPVVWPYSADPMAQFKWKIPIADAPRVKIAALVTAQGTRFPLGQLLRYTKLQEGVTYLELHVAKDGPGLSKYMPADEDFGGAWRVADFAGIKATVAEGVLDRLGIHTLSVGDAAREAS